MVTNIVKVIARPVIAHVWEIPGILLRRGERSWQKEKGESCSGHEPWLLGW